MRKLATIRRITAIQPIEGADRLELAKIDGWQCVVGKGEFNTGELVVYFEIDSALPADDPRYEFLHERCLKKWMNHGTLVKEVVRIKTIKLRGVISQGLLMPLEAFEKELSVFRELLQFFIPEWDDAEFEGTDLTKALNVLHYDELADIMGRVTGTAQLGGEQKGLFPHFIPKTDEERLQNLPEYFESMKEVPFECTEKFDGSSMTVFWASKHRPEDPYGVCSRNFELKLDSEKNCFIQVAGTYDLYNKLSTLGRDIALQGELVGPGVNGNKDQYTDYEFRIFRIYDIEKQAWLAPEERYTLCKELGLPHVKVILDRWEVFKDLKNMEAFLQYVEGKTDRGHEREGMVWKSMDGTVSFKVINNNYLLKQKD